MQELQLRCVQTEPGHDDYGRRTIMQKTSFSNSEVPIGFLNKTVYPSVHPEIQYPGARNEG